MAAFESPLGVLQWGRTLSSAEVISPTGRSPTTCTLQWGRTLSSAEVRHPALAPRGCPGASMGPHSFKCGSNIEDLIETAQGLASMGPHSFKCGSFPYVSFGLCRTKSFNGAALFQVRKCADTVEELQPHRAASMGPHSFKCGSKLIRNHPTNEILASMGPHSFKCGSSLRRRL